MARKLDGQKNIIASGALTVVQYIEGDGGGDGGGVNDTQYIMRDEWRTQGVRTFSQPMTLFSVENKGATDLTFSIGSVSLVVKPAETFDGVFEPFSQVTVTGTFEATVSSAESAPGHSIKYAFSGSASVTKNFSSPVTHLGIANDGGSTISYSINGVAFTVDPGEAQERYFGSFSTVSVTAAVPFRAYVKGVYQVSAPPPVVGPGDTPPPADTTAPADVQNLQATNVSTNSLTLSWNASVSSDVAAYEVYRGASLLGTVAGTAGTTFSVTGLSPSTAYTFTVKAKDNAGNVSAGSSLTQTTAAPAADTTPPPNVQGLQATNVTSSGCTLSWQAVTASDLKDYQVYNGTTLIATVTATTYNVTGLSQSTGYTFVVKARDTSNNEATGQSVGITTTAEPAVPPSAFDLNTLSAYPSDTTVSFDKTVDWNGTAYSDFVHPSVLYFPSGWNGHRWWMGINPYAATQGSTENPYLFYSDDGDNWKTPAGLTQPIYGKDADVGNNSDSNIFMDYDGVTMHYLNRGALPAGGSMIEIFSTTNGVNFTARKRIVQTAVDVDYVSPCVVKYSSKYYMFAIDGSDQTHIAVLEATTPTGTWTEINRISTGLMGSIWHLDVQYLNNEFIVIGNNGGAQGGSLMLGKFSTPMDTTATGREIVLAYAPGTQTYNQRIYKSCLVIKNETDMELFVGTKGGALDANTRWRVSRAPLTRAATTLNFDTMGYQLMSTYPDNSTFTALPGGKSMAYDSNRYALDFTITSLSGTPAAFARSSSQMASLRINRLDEANNPIAPELNSELWGISGGGKVKKISYGLQVNDRVTMMLDTDYEFYINGRLVHKEPNIGDQFNLIGTSFGTKDGSVALSDIKVYKKDAYIYSQTKADTRKSNLLSEYGTTPANFILVDEFNRADGAVTGTSDNGVAYEIVGTPNIVSNTLKPNGANAVLVPVTGNYSVNFKLVNDDLTHGFGVYLKYTDANNYVKFSCGYDFDVGEYTLIKIYTLVDGVETITTARTPGAVTQYRNWRVEVIDGFAHAYMDTVYQNKIAIPSQPFADKLGFTSGAAGTQYDYIIVKKL